MEIKKEGGGDIIFSQVVQPPEKETY